mmetsp:Transcript_32390/g.92250  ORF Transcript_32390/g.92250 Transcript_32390/m.92250 type:complete len:378 (+) Transcript_32390:248-1381(+)
MRGTSLSVYLCVSPPARRQRTHVARGKPTAQNLPKGFVGPLNCRLNIASRAFPFSSASSLSFCFIACCSSNFASLAWRALSISSFVSGAEDEESVPPPQTFAGLACSAARWSSCVSASPRFSRKDLVDSCAPGCASGDSAACPPTFATASRRLLPETMFTTCRAWPRSIKTPSQAAIFCEASRMALASCSGGGEGLPPSSDLAKSKSPAAEVASMAMGAGPSGASAPGLGASPDCGEAAQAVSVAGSSRASAWAFASASAGSSTSCRCRFASGAPSGCASAVAGASAAGLGAVMSAGAAVGGAGAGPGSSVAGAAGSGAVASHAVVGAGSGAAAAAFLATAMASPLRRLASERSCSERRTRPLCTRRRSMPRSGRWE